MNSLSVAVANLPIASFSLATELAEAGTPLLPGASLLLLFLRLLLTTTPATIQPAMIKEMKTAAIAHINLLLDFLPGADDC